MLRTRVWMGSVLAAVTAGVLFGTQELWRMLPAADRPDPRVTVVGVLLILAANWVRPTTDAGPPFAAAGATFIASVLATFVYEIVTYDGDGHASRRVAFAIFFFAYLGLLPSFLVQLRWLPAEVSGAALAAAIFVPKVGDIFALLTGMTFGRHPLTPRLSPKKTWEGFAGGLIAAVVTAVTFRYVVPPLFQDDTRRAIAFGLAVGLAGVFGDLAESMLKRDCQLKDASRSIPGFGGVLDVVDSVVFAAPVAYLLLTI